MAVRMKVSYSKGEFSHVATRIMLKGETNGTAHEPIVQHMNQWDSTLTNGTAHEPMGQHINQWDSTSAVKISDWPKVI